MPIGVENTENGDKTMDTDFPAYSDTVYSDTPLTVTVLAVPNWHFIYKKRCGYSDTPLTVTLFSRPEGVTVIGEVCTALRMYLSRNPHMTRP